MFSRDEKMQPGFVGCQTFAQGFVLLAGGGGYF